MRLIDIVSAPWAITPEMHEEVLQIYGRHVRGEKIDIAALEARVGMPLRNAQQPMTTDGGSAVISIEGALSKRMNLLSQISGGASTQMIGAQFAQALADPDVKQIVLLVDSPGGTVDGTQQLADQIYAARGQKPIVAVVDGMCCSAAYWIASAADRVYITGDTANVGSIGVIATHVDRSMAQAQHGVKVTDVKAGKYKAQGSANAPLGAGEVTMQDMVDKIYQTFMSDVARNRDVPLETVQQDMADGRVFIGRDAIAAGLVDGVSTLDDVLATGAGNTPAFTNAERAGVAPQASTSTEETPMNLTIEKVKAEAPDVAAALAAEGAAQAAKATGDALAKARSEGAAAERQRLADIEALALPGCEKLVAEAKADPACTADAFARKAIAFQKERGSRALADLQTDARSAETTSAAAPADGAKGPVIDPVAVAAKARDHIEAQARLGNRVSAAEATAHIVAQLSAA